MTPGAKRPNRRRRLSTGMRRILIALASRGDMEAEELAEAASMRKSTLVCQCIAPLRSMGLIRIRKWRRKVAPDGGPPAPTYQIMPGAGFIKVRADAPRPERLSSSVKAKRWRKAVGYTNATRIERAEEKRQAATLNALIAITGGAKEGRKWQQTAE